MPAIELELSIEVECDSCKTDLQASVYMSGDNIVVRVSPCPNCTETTRDEAIAETIEAIENNKSPWN